MNENKKTIENLFKKSHPKSTIELLSPDTMRYNDIVLRNINDNNDHIILLQFATFNAHVIVEYISQNDWDEKLYSSQIYNSVISKSHPNSHITIIDVNSPEYREALKTVFFTKVNGVSAVILQATYCDNHAIIEFMEKDVYEYIVRKDKHND